MSTNAVIGMIEPCGSIKASFLHWDGYPSHAGAILQLYYNTPESIAGLLAFGHISSLADMRLKNARFPDTDSLLASSTGLYVYLWDGKEWLIFDQKGSLYAKTS